MKPLTQAGILAVVAFVAVHAWRALVVAVSVDEQTVAAALLLGCAVVGVFTLLGLGGSGEALPDLIGDLRRDAEIFEVGAAHLSVQVQEDARHLRIEVLAQNLYDAPTDFRLVLDAVGAAAGIPPLQMALPTGGLVTATIRVPLGANDGWLDGRLDPHADCPVPAGAERVRAGQRRPLTGRPVRKALKFEVAPGPEGQSRCPAQWTERVVWSPRTPTDHDTLVTRLRRAR